MDSIDEFSLALTHNAVFMPMCRLCVCVCVCVWLWFSSETTVILMVHRYTPSTQPNSSPWNKWRPFHHWKYDNNLLC